MIDELLKEIEELRSYKKKYEHTCTEKQKMSNMLYEYMMKEYESMTKEERIKKYKEECCSCCREDVYYCDFPDDIMKPISSDKAYIPERLTCGKFVWA